MQERGSNASLQLGCGSGSCTRQRLRNGSSAGASMKESEWAGIVHTVCKYKAGSVIVSEDQRADWHGR